MLTKGQSCLFDRPFTERFTNRWGGVLEESLKLQRSGKFFLIRDFIGRTHFVYLPLLTYTDLDPLTARGLAFSSAHNRIHIRVLCPQKRSLPGDPVVSRLILDGNCPELIWQTLSPEVRNRVRFGIKSGLVFEQAQLRVKINAYYSAYEEHQTRFGMPLLPKRFFFELADQCSAVVATVSDNGLVLASALQVRDQELMWLPWIHTSLSGNRFSASDFLYWNLVKSGFSSKVKILDFGRSALDSGAHRFKKKWGAVTIPVMTVGESKSNVYQRYRLAQKIWSKFPMVISRKFSNYVITKLPDL